MATRDDEFKKFKAEVMDKISPSFCAAKWYNATIWLNSGHTTSCHHPEFHEIDVEEIKTNPSAIHNTKEKKFQRKQMLSGERPKGCDYCWTVEDLNKGNISDRVYKTIIYGKEDINKIVDEYGSDKDVDLKTLEVAFDRTCNLACSYCNPSFSSTWANDINKHGPYLGIRYWDSGSLKSSLGNYGSCKDEENPYIKAFWEWWPKLVKSLQEFRVTGGEPLLSPDVWKILDYFERHDSGEMVFAINSNLSAKDELIDKLVKKSHNIKKFDLYTSCEATGKQAEYIRDGLDYEQFKTNMEKCIEQGNFKTINVMLTISGLCLFSITDFFDQMMEWKAKYGVHYPTWTVNILTFPAFMSCVSLPKDIRYKRADVLKEWLEKNQDSPLLLPHELASVQRLIDYLLTVEKSPRLGATPEVNEKNFKMFYQQYDKRRKKSFEDTFPKELVNWYHSI